MNKAPDKLSKFIGNWLIPGLIILTMISYILDPIMLLHIAGAAVVVGVAWIFGKVLGW